jgi:uncharacterized protein YjbJ (UPF0337 family)
MPVVASATLEVTPVMAGAQQSITEQLTGAALPAAEKTGQESGSKFSSSLVKGIGAGSVAVAGAVAGVSGALIKTAGDTAAYGDQIDKASQKLGVSSTFYQEWQADLQHSGTDMDKMSATFKKLATASQDASADQQAAFEKLGLSMDDVSKMSPEELFTHVISGLQGMEEGTERTSLATTLLGKGAMEMGALLNTSSEDTQAMIDKVHDLGGVMGEDAVKASARYQDSLQDMQTAFDGIKNGVGAKLLPVLADFMDKVADFITNTDLTPLTDMVGKAVEGLGNFISNLDIEAIGNTFQTVVTTIGEVLGTAWDAMSIVFDALQGAFQTITDSLNTTGTDWSDVWNGISEVITTVATVIGEIIGIIASVIAGLITEAQTEGTLFNAVWESIQIAIQAAGDIIKGVIDFISALLSGDWKGAWDAAEGVVETMTNAIDNVVTTIFNGIADFLLSVWNTIKNTVSNAVTAVKDKISNVFSAARDTVHNIFEDIKNGVRQKFVDMVRDVLGKVIAIKDGIKERFQQAKDTALRIFDDIKNGIKDKIEWAKDKVSGIVDTIKNLFDFDWSLPDLKLPHISITEYLDVPGLGTIPAPWGIHVDWYAKAYDSPYLFTSPTVMNGRGFGDRGNRYGGELVYSHDKLMDDIRRASGGGTFAPTINVYTQENQSNEEIAQYVMDKLTREYQRAARYV